MKTMVKGPDAATLFWDGLAEELSVWQAHGRVATFWWRDDDAAAASPSQNRVAASGPLTMVFIAPSYPRGPAHGDGFLAATLEERPACPMP